MSNQLQARNAPQDTLRIKPVTPFLGAEVEGIDLSCQLDAQAREQIRLALLEHEVLVFRGQDLTLDQYVAFGQIFGEVQASAKSFFDKHDSHPFVEVLENDEQRPPSINVWHSDITWQKEPPLGSCNYVRALPEVGGDTMWASMTAAYDRLSPSMQAYLADKQAVHTWEKSGFTEYLQSKGGEQYRAAQAKYPPVLHPVIRTHPETGKKIVYVNETFTSHIVGVSREESEAILGYLYQLPRLPEIQVRFRWEKDSIVVWDNRSTQHYAVADYFPHHRKLFRMTIGGDAPF
ncbi:taurine dioxygenase, 2-oxoglutarate-dependent [Cupriavidus necator]|uniref:Taurine dioxygenase, 2-oxoglutarate-dependent n=1 Tax=Cupriavidus necator TaxID=106590 RepID=A0A1K0JUC0_CUPNE|nr:taurine dioxygenase, 2-oxoglutarate-dependent [Cupriavidus necator]